MDEVISMADIYQATVAAAEEAGTLESLVYHRIDPLSPSYQQQSEGASEAHNSESYLFGVGFFFAAISG